MSDWPTAAWDIEPMPYESDPDWEIRQASEEDEE